MGFAENIVVCHRCEYSASACNGQCPCKADSRQRDIGELAEQDACPLGYFGTKAVDADSTPEHIIEVLSRATKPILAVGWHGLPGAREAYSRLTNEFRDRTANANIIHVFDGFDINGHPDENRNGQARTTWGGKNVTLLPFTPTRTAADLGSTRPLPFINDILDWACLNAAVDDIVVWSNLDICFAPNAYDEIRAALTWQDAVYTRRVDVADATDVPAGKLFDNNFGPGVDCVAFRPHWWRSVRAEMPDMLIATHAFDIVLAELVNRTSPTPEITNPRITWHELHDWSWWKQNTTDAARLHNDRQFHARKFADQPPGVPLEYRSQGRTAQLRRMLNRFPVGMNDAETPNRYSLPLVIMEPGNHGDLLGLMPGLKHLADKGHKIVYLCKKGMGEFLEGLDWIQCHEFEREQLTPELAQRLGRPLPATAKRKNWTLQSWTRLGLSDDLYYSLPLEIENRRPDAEAEFADLAKGNRPIILFNAPTDHPLGGSCSSPYNGSDELFEKLSGRFRGCQWIDLRQLKAEKFRDLLGLFEKADAIVTTDTGTLHLGHATKTPTIALLNDDPWFASEPRSHWKLHMTYADSRTDEGLKAIEEAIGQILMGNRKPEPFIRKMAHGAAGITKAVSGTGGASEEVIAYRTMICSGCPHAKVTAGAFQTCRLCGCSTWAKVRSSSEKCPIGRWGATAPA